MNTTTKVCLLLVLAFLLFSQVVATEPIYCNDIESSDASVCSGNGACTSNDTCVCDAGFMGTNCEDILACNGIYANETGVVCSGNGTCQANATCLCDQGYTGDNCDQAVDNNNNNGGNNGNVITCDGIESTDSSVCSGRGNCTANDVCVCDAGYDAASFCANSTNNNNNNGGNNGNVITCDGIESTESSVCSGRGNCTANDVCVCDAGYEAASFCANSTNNNGGNNNDNVITCDGIESTESSVCSGRGNCTANDVCVCNTGYDAASFCANSTNSNNNNGGNNGGNTPVIMCNGILSTNTKSVCTGNGECTANNTCVCKSDFEGKYCSDVKKFTVNKVSGIKVSKLNFTSFELSWDESNVVGAMYIIYIVSPKPALVSDGTETKYAFTGLTAGTAYNISITAKKLTSSSSPVYISVATLSQGVPAPAVAGAIAPLAIPMVTKTTIPAGGFIKTTLPEGFSLSESAKRTANLFSMEDSNGNSISLSDFTTSGNSVKAKVTTTMNPGSYVLKIQVKTPTVATAVSAATVESLDSTGTALESFEFSLPQVTVQGVTSPTVSTSPAVSSAKAVTAGFVCVFMTIAALLF